MGATKKTKMAAKNVAAKNVAAKNVAAKNVAAKNVAAKNVADDKLTRAESLAIVNGAKPAASKPAASKPAAKPAASETAASKPAASETRDSFGCPVGSGSHFACAALVKLSGKDCKPVTLGQIVTEAEALAGGPVREPFGIVRAMQVGKLAERAGRGAVKLTPAGWKRWHDKRAPVLGGIVKTVHALRDGQLS